MNPEEFRLAGHQLIDWLADERANVRSHRVLGAQSPGSIYRSFPESAPAGVSSIEEILSLLSDVVVPGATAVQHPMHFGWFPSNASLSSVLGDLASSGLGGLGISWESNPALTEVEQVMCNWMRQLVGLSDAWQGTIHDTASTSALVALLCARERASGFSQESGGLSGLGTSFTVYASTQAHSSVPKAALLAGFGRDNLCLVNVDENYAVDLGEFRKALDADIASGKVPTAVIVSIGTTATTAFDPLSDIVEIAREHNIWVHVDAAMAGSAMLLPECRHLWDGVEGADSITWNPHKWMGTVLDTSMFLIRDLTTLNRVMSTNPSYLLPTSVEETPTEYRDWGIPLGRRFRALKLWFQLRLDGVESIQARLRRDLANATWLADQVGADPAWEIIAPVQLQTVCVLHTPAGCPDVEELNRHTLAWVKLINTSGKAFLSPTKLGDRWIARVSIGVEGTERSDVAEMWNLMRSAVV